MRVYYNNIMHSDEDKTIFRVCVRALIDSEKKIYVYRNDERV